MKKFNINIVYGFLVILLVLLLVKPVEASNRILVQQIFPALVTHSLRIPSPVPAITERQVNIKAVANSEVFGNATLVEVPENLDTKISFRVSGLKAEVEYLPIYHLSTDCETEINSVEKSINGSFFADDIGEYFAEDTVKDSINKIKSVSIRDAKTFELIACGNI